MSYQPQERPLTPNQEAFCLHIFQGNSQFESYCLAYPNARKWDRNAVDSNASQMMDDTRVAQRIAELRERVTHAVVADLEQRKSKLREIVNHEIETPVSAGHRVAAAKELNLMERVYTESHNTQPMVAIQVVLPSGQSTQNTQLYPELAVQGQSEAKRLDITPIVRSNEANPIATIKRLVGGHRWTPEEKAQLMREVFGDDDASTPGRRLLVTETPPTLDFEGRGEANTK